jgi:hypothetical protein
MNKEAVLNYFGTSTNLAKKLSISAAAVSKWRDVIPEKQALKLEKLTNGLLAYDPTLYKSNHV